VTGWLALLAWALAASALHLRGRRQLVLAARAKHEVRGPLCTAQLALDGLERSARVEAIGMELRRAALALDDLGGARRRRWLDPLGRAPRRRWFDALGSARRRRWLDALGSARRRRWLDPLVAAQRPRGPSSSVDVARLLADAAPVWRALADAHGAVLAVQPAPAFVVGDPLRLAQACANLVANAVEHGGGRVRVTSLAAGGRVRVEVADLGAGLPAPLPELLAAARGRRSARGHGLAITAAIAGRHGGRLIAIPALRGAHLALDLPEAPAPRGLAPPPAAPSLPAANPPRS
jgi:signal transduction histidine kinase